MTRDSDTRFAYFAKLLTQGGRAGNDDHMTRLFLFTDNAVIEIAPKHPTVRALADVGRQTRNRGHALIRPDGTLVGGAAPK